MIIKDKDILSDGSLGGPDIRQDKLFIRRKPNEYN